MESRHTVQHWVDHLESLVDLLSNFRTSQDNLATDENEKHNLRFDHAIDLKRRKISVWDVTRRIRNRNSSPRLTRPGKSSGS